MNIRASVQKLALLSFICAYPLDAIFFGLHSRMGIKIPIGFLGILLSIAVLIMSLFVRQKTKNYIVVYIIGLYFFICTLLLFRSELSNWGDVYYFLVALGQISVGYYLIDYFLKKDNGKISMFFLFSIIACFIIYLIPSSGSYYNYLRSADAIVITSFFLLAQTKSRQFIFIIFLVTLITLYYVNSRASIILYCVSTFLYFGILWGKVRTLLIATVCSIIFGSWLFYIYNTIDNIHNNRLVRLLFQRENDTSLSARIMLKEKAKAVFHSNPLTGEFAYYRAEGLQGAYAHDYFSLIADFGIIGIVIVFLIFSCFLFSLLKLNKVIKNNNAISVFGFSLMVIMYAVLGFLLAKDYTWNPLFLGVGLSIYTLLNIKNRIYR